MTLMGRLEKWGGTIAANHVHICPMLQQDAANMVVADLGCNPQRSGAIDALGVRFSTSRQQQRQKGAVAILGSDEHWRGTILTYTLQLL